MHFVDAHDHLSIVQRLIIEHSCDIRVMVIAAYEPKRDQLAVIPPTTKGDLIDFNVVTVPLTPAGACDLQRTCQHSSHD